MVKVTGHLMDLENHADLDGAIAMFSYPFYVPSSSD